MNQVQYQVLLATKSARCVQAARGRPIADFAARRTHGTEASLKMARASYVAGFGATSNVLAARRYGIPLTGTMAHSYITSFDAEIDAFRAYSRMFPDRSILLLDTYDTVNAAHAAVTVARKRWSATAIGLSGVRLDSGDFRRPQPSGAAHPGRRQSRLCAHRRQRWPRRVRNRPPSLRRRAH